MCVCVSCVCVCVTCVCVRVCFVCVCVGGLRVCVCVSCVSWCRRWHGESAGGPLCARASSACWKQTSSTQIVVQHKGLPTSMPVQSASSIQCPFCPFGSCLFNPPVRDSQGPLLGVSRFWRSVVPAMRVCVCARVSVSV